MLSNELSLLAIYGLIVAVTLVLQASGFLMQAGLGYLLSSRDEGLTPQGMAARIDRALGNSIVAMALFAPPILILAVKDAFSGQSLIAAQIFVLARLIYVPAYVFGIIGLRTFVWTLGFFATVLLYFLAL